MDKMSKYTPGPWTKGAANDCHKVFSSTRVVAEVFGSTRGRKRNPKHEEAQANARLIAAAPEMYAMLKDLHSSECAKGRPFAIDTTRQCGLCDLIAKVQGKTRGLI